MFGFRRKHAGTVPAGLGRRALVARARREAGGDPAFQELVTTADQARYRGEFTAAIAAYRQALARYPLHSGYWTQLGHAWQELGSWCEAEIAYRSAIALGEREAWVHLAFVVERGGGVYDRGWTERVAAFWSSGEADLFATPPTRGDVTDAIELLCDRGEVAADEIRELMAACATRRELLARLLAGEEFRRYHKDLLRLIAQTGWAG